MADTRRGLTYAEVDVLMSDDSNSRRIRHNHRISIHDGLCHRCGLDYDTILKGIVLKCGRPD